MRSARTRAFIGWVVPLALAALPGCGFHSGVLPFNFDPGETPRSSVVFCDIEKPQGRHCATDTDKLIGIRLSAAAVSLVAAERTLIGLDDSPDALARCGGEPEAVEFQGPFPDGLPVCLNCSQIGLPPAPYADAATVCVVKCEDLAAPFQPLDPAVADFCNAHAHVSANFLPVGSACLDDACGFAGGLRDDFDDSRRLPEPVDWRDELGVTATGSDLTRTAPNTANGPFDAGADGSQVIEHGDAYVEFTAAELNDARAAGLSNGPPPDTTPTLANLDFGLMLAQDGRFYVFERAVKAAGPDLNQSFGRYAPLEAFRVHVRDKGDGTGTISYGFLTSSCTHPASCPETIFYTSPTAAHYPVRIDTTFRDPGATLTDVRVVRIR